MFVFRKNGNIIVAEKDVIQGFQNKKELKLFQIDDVPPEIMQNLDCYDFNFQKSDFSGFILKNDLLNAKKLSLIRNIRDSFLQYSIPLNMQKQSEERLIARGKLNINDVKITDTVINYYDDLFQKLRDLPTTINLSNLNLSDIRPDNTTIFGVFPPISEIWNIPTD